MKLEDIIKAYTKDFKVRLTDSLQDMHDYYGSLYRQQPETAPLVVTLSDYINRDQLRPDVPIWTLVRSQLNIKDLFSGVLEIAIDTSDPANPRLVNTGTDAELALDESTLKSLIDKLCFIRSNLPTKGEIHATEPIAGHVPDPYTINS